MTAEKTKRREREMRREDVENKRRNACAFLASDVAVCAVRLLWPV